MTFEHSGTDMVGYPNPCGARNLADDVSRDVLIVIANVKGARAAVAIKQGAWRTMDVRPVPAFTDAAPSRIDSLWRENGALLPS